MPGSVIGKRSWSYAGGRFPALFPALALVAALVAARPGVAQEATQPPPASPLATSPAAYLDVRLENPLALARPDEVVSLDWAVIRRHLPDAGVDRIRAVDAATAVELPSQVLDDDGDGEADALLVLVSFWPGEARRLRIEAAPAAPVEVRTYAHYEAHRDDVAWESDRIAFRMYGQGLWQASEYQPLVSSGIDLWLKRVREPIIERWYARGHDAYHVDTGDGADFFTVGQSLGGGGSAVWRDGRLHRARNFRSHRILAAGPIRAVFELHYDPWDAAGVQVSEIKRITMDAGQHLFRQEITYRITGADEVTYAVGTVRRDGLVGSMSRAAAWAWLSTWGPVELGAGGHGHLGTAVLMERDRVIEMRETDDHFLVLARARNGETTVQLTGAGWTAGGDVPDVAAWWRHLDEMALRLEHPIRITVGSGP